MIKSPMYISPLFALISANTIYIKNEEIKLDTSVPNWQIPTNNIIQ